MQWLQYGGLIDEIDNEIFCSTVDADDAHGGVAAAVASSTAAALVAPPTHEFLELVLNVVKQLSEESVSDEGVNIAAIAVRVRLPAKYKDATEAQVRQL